MPELSSEEIRKLVREALNEALPIAKENGGALPQVVGVEIASDADLDRFAREIAKADDGKREAIAQGRLKFVLRRGRTQPLQGTRRLDKGVLTETMVVEIARAHSTISIGTNVAVTPLARDKAREMKLEIVRDRP
jgi:hypothetical protein